MDLALIHTISVWVAIALLFLIFTMVSFVDAIKKEFNTHKQKMLWVLITLIPFIGWLIYLLFGYRQGKKNNMY